MPRQPLLRSETHCYHVTARTDDQEFFPGFMSDVWKVFMCSLLEIQERCEVKIHAFVLMGNHFHLLLQTPKGNLDQAMHLLMRNVALSLKIYWGSRYKWSLISTSSHYYQVYRYIYQNPLRANLVQQVENYPFSTLVFRVPFVLHDRVALEFGSKKAELLWLNERGSLEQEALIKKGLKHFQFDVNKKKLRLFEKLKEPQKD